MKTDIFEIMYLKGDITFWEMIFLPILTFIGITIAVFIVYSIVYFIVEVGESYKK